ncbi:hypothetical protein [Nonomuraea sp. B19D2]|uniref:hypothetical protein n=1 Tax=Nonomuraea sp. B19D2 TaxID=3159561 RepID=UPI0032DB6A87
MNLSRRSPRLAAIRRTRRTALATCANGLALQPPARSQMTGPLAAYLVNGPLNIA